MTYAKCERDGREATRYANIKHGGEWPLDAMEEVRKGKVTLRVHGQQRGSQSGEFVLAAVFAERLVALVRALRAADKIANGSKNHDYAITALTIGSAEATLAEQAAPRFYPGMTGRSGVKTLDTCLSLVGEGNAEAGRRFGPVLAPLAKLARGSGKVFSYAELWMEDRAPIRIDALLAEQVELVEAKAFGTDDVALYSEDSERWFEGVALGTFDGEIKQVDLRGSLPQVKLVLTAGRKEIDCVLRQPDVERLRENLDRRVRVSGRAFYDGKSGLPRRIEVMDIAPIKRGGDIQRWKQSFAPFTIEPWEGDNE